MKPKKTKTKGTGLVVPPTVQVATADIQEAPYNPNVMTTEEQDALELSMRRHGLVLDVLLQKHSEEHGPLVLIGGHWRMRIARRICEADGTPFPEFIGAKVLDVTDRVAAELNVALNGVHGHNDPMRLGELLARYSFDDTELACMAIAREQEAALIALTKTTDEQAAQLEAEAAGLREFARSVTLTVEFDTVAQRDQVKGTLVARAKAKGQKAGAVLASILIHDATAQAAAE